MTIALETHDLRKVYKAGQRGEVLALQGLDLEIQRGHVFGFIGPNGAGKTTCIKILSGLAWPTSGSARIFGHAASSIQARACLGYLPEVASYHDFMTVDELLMTHADLSRMPRADRGKACDAALETVGLTQRRRSRIRELSKGMQQRFGIAQALVGNPQLLILDEPTSGLDPLAQKEIKDVILQLRGRGITIFFSSHKLTEVENICDLVGILHRGRLLCCTTLEALLETTRLADISFTGSDVDLFGTEVLTDARHRLTRVPRERVDATLDTIRAAGGSVVSIAPCRRTLESAFFDLITDADSVPEGRSGESPPSIR